jgi:HEAT repeat protein
MPPRTGHLNPSRHEAQVPSLVESDILKLPELGTAYTRFLRCGLFGMAASLQRGQFAILVSTVALSATAWTFARIESAHRSEFSSTSPESSVNERRIAGRTLAEWGAVMQTRDHFDPARSADVPGLLVLIEDESLPWYVRRNAALTLGRWGEPAAIAIPMLVRLVEERQPSSTGDDPEAITPLWALKGLALFGAVAAPAAPSVRKAALDSTATESVRLAAIDGLSRIGPAAPTVIPTLLEILSTARNDPAMQHTLQRAAIEALGMQRAAAASATPALTQLLDDTDPVLRREAAAALGMIGPAAGQSESGLWERFLYDEDPTVGDAAGKSLVQLGPQTLPTFQQVLDEGDAGLRERVATQMAGFGPSGATALPTLLQLQADPEPSVRMAVAEAVRSISRQPQPAANTAVELLTANDRGVRRRAYRLLQSLGPQVVVVQPQLESLSSHPDRTIRSAVERLREQIHPPDP